MEFDIALNNGLSLKIRDTFSGENDFPTSRLQKGLILWHNDLNLSEEAVGFGVPILKKGLLTIFPGELSLIVHKQEETWLLHAIYKLNLVEKIAKGEKQYIENKWVYGTKNFLASVIRHLPLFRRLLTSTSSKLRQVLNWQTAYEYAGFSTEITMNYTIIPEAGKIFVEMVTADLPTGVTEVVVMNEQGARAFDRYSDASKVSTCGDAIGCWDEVNASGAWFESSAYGVEFKLEQAKGARLFRGRELVGSRLAWAGFGYSIPPSLKEFAYELTVKKLP